MTPIVRLFGALLVGVTLLVGCADAELRRRATDTASSQPAVALQEYEGPGRGTFHDAVPDGAGWVWYTLQSQGALGGINPSTGETALVPLGQGSAPHGVIMGPEGDIWITDGGLNAIVRVRRASLDVQVYRLPGPRANLNTAAFDGRGLLWFTGQAGYIGSVDPATGAVRQFETPRGAGPYGVAATPDGTVYFASLAGGYLGRIDDNDGAVTVLTPPTANAGVRRVWSDSRGRLWVSEYNAGQLGRYDPATGAWAELRLPGERPRPYAVYVDHRDHVWLSDHGLGGGGGANTLVHFDPDSEMFTTVASAAPLRVAQLGGVPGEVWGADRDRQRLVVVRY